MTTGYLFETIPLAGGGAGHELEQEWPGQEPGEYETEGEYGRSRGLAGGRRRIRPVGPRRRSWRPRTTRSAGAVPGWLALPDEQPLGTFDGGPSLPADGAGDFSPVPPDPGHEPYAGAAGAPSVAPGQPCGCAPPCDCAACQGAVGAPAQPEDPPGDEEFAFEIGGGVLFETLELAAPGDGALASPGGRAGSGPAACATSFVDCPPRGVPSLVLDAFGFDQSSLNAARHGPLLVGLARRIIASQGTAYPIRSILIAGHTDPVGADDYNFALARRRAETVARELCRTIERMRPGGSRGLSVRLTSCGERQTRARPEESRRVEIFLPAAPSGPGRKNPPEHSHCGIPRRALQREAEFEAELQAELQAELENELQAEVGVGTPRRGTRTVQPRLCFFQNHPTTSHRNHFQCQADRWAKRVSAQSSPRTGSCPRRVGGSSYNSGAAIVAAISAAHRCQRRRLDAVHIFSHGGSHGIFGATTGTVGLYIDTDPQSRAQGARTAADIPTAALAENVVFVLHGCNTASDTDNIARALFKHLAARLRDPKVFGHTNGGCCGRDNSWREYSRRSPDGTVRPRTLAPHYEGNGCCG